MNKNREIARAVLEQVGGAENIESLLHCMTRLRFKLKDESVVSLEQIKAIKGVLGTQFAEGTLHVIIGTTVADVYKELIEISGLEKQKKLEENLDTDTSDKKKWSVKGIVSSVFNTFASSMTPLIPLFVAMGMMNVIASLIGPSFLNLVSEESDLYKNFYFVYQAILYFLPVFVAISASRIFKCSTMLSVTMAGLMLYPDLVNAIAAEGGFSVYGLTVPNVAYDGQVIPILLVVWILSYVEKFVGKYISKALKVIGVPVCTLLIMLPLQFLVLGPVGTYIGTGLASVILTMYNTMGVVETTLIGAIGIFTVAFGFGRPIFFVCLSILMSTGVEYAYLPVSIVITNWVAMGIAAGYAIKAKSTEKKELGFSCLASAFLGGVSEPTIFGIIMQNRQTFKSCLIAGGLAGLYIGITKVGYYQFGPSNFLNVMGFIGGESSANFVHGCIAAGIAIVAAFVSMLIFYKDETVDNK